MQLEYKKKPLIKLLERYIFQVGVRTHYFMEALVVIFVRSSRHWLRGANLFSFFFAIFQVKISYHAIFGGEPKK